MNSDKSKLVSVGNVRNTIYLASNLGCKMSTRPISYLGLLLGAASKVIAIRGTVIEKIE